MTTPRNLEIVEILLVEDSPSDAELMIETFSDCRVLNHLHWVQDGVEAIQFLRRQGAYREVVRPDLILLDLNLPKKDGREVLAEIKADEDLKIIPVVVLTTSEAEEDILRSYNLHANCYMTKPVDLDRFIEVVRLIEGFWLVAVRLPKPQ
ncbi:response regulator [Tumidithrix helvetica]|uniref:response regulator n=1 Tax=Tumidithrix helvetica TaxID=3457545 RepID=UPI003CC5A82A